MHTKAGVEAVYAYKADGMRHSKKVNGAETIHVWDGANIAVDIAGSSVVSYVRGIGLLKAGTVYYAYNGHGDVVQLTNGSGVVTKTYDYDAFGVERNPVASDTNAFRYAGEYFDKETGTYYLRVRYYQPKLGRFSQEDTHWHVGNMIYGDNPVKWNEREANPKDPLGLNTYTYKPDITAIIQSGNLYAYCMNNPLMWIDPNGEAVTPANIVGAVIGAGGGGALGVLVADHYGLTGWKRNLTIAGFTVGGGAVGWFAAPLVEKLAMQIAVALGIQINQGVQAIGAKASGAIGSGLIANIDKGVNFSKTALERMTQPGRFVPVQILIDVIKQGASMNDPQGSSALMYYSQVIINGLRYNIEVLYDKASNTIWHFMYY